MVYAGFFVLFAGPLDWLVCAGALSTAFTAPGAAFTGATKVMDEEIGVLVNRPEETGGGGWTEFSGRQTGESAASESTVRPAGSLPIAPAQYLKGDGEVFIACGSSWLRNYTKLSPAAVSAEMMQELPFKIKQGSSEPQVLIMHTHATETYQLDENLWYDPAFTCRTTDTRYNMVRIGAEIASRLNAAGICTIQDQSLNDYPSYNGSYAKSKARVEEYLKKYPSIKVVLDVHRDAIEKEDGTRIKPVVTLGGQTAAQVMIICGADDGTMNMPNYMQNLRFASRLQNSMEQVAPGMARPLMFAYRNYNQQLTTGSLLIEVGGHANCLEEALLSARYISDALIQLFTKG